MAKYNTNIHNPSNVFIVDQLQMASPGRFLLKTTALVELILGYLHAVSTFHEILEGKNQIRHLLII